MTKNLNKLNINNNTFSKEEIDAKVDKITSKGFNIHRALKVLRKFNFDEGLALSHLQQKTKECFTIRAFGAPWKHKREERYHEMFPEDKEFNWEKFRAAKKDERANKYKEMFPNDDTFNWGKFICKKLEKKLESEEFQKKKFEKFFPGEEFNLEKLRTFMQNKKAEKIGLKMEIYKKIFPNDKEVDMEKIKNLKLQGLNFAKEKFEKVFPGEEFNIFKLKNHWQTKLENKERMYHEMFPEDKEIDWDKFMKVKWNKQEFKEKKYKKFFPDDKEFDWNKFEEKKNEKFKKWEEKFAKAFPGEPFSLNKFKDLKEIIQEKWKNWKTELKFNSDSSDMDEQIKPKCNGFLGKLKNIANMIKEKTSAFSGFKTVKEEKYREMFPEDKEFDWKKFRMAKQEERAIRQEERAIKQEKKAEIEKELIREWKDSYETVFLDGNNLLYVDEDIRKATLKKNGDKLLESLAEEFGKLAKVKKVVLVFDHSKYVVNRNCEGLKLHVCSARPDFKSSDDALVDWTKKMSASSLETAIYVTSDRGLFLRLKEAGATNLMPAKAWFRIADNLLGKKSN